MRNTYMIAGDNDGVWGKRMLRTFFSIVIFSLFGVALSAQSITNYSFTPSTGTFTPLSGATTAALSTGTADDGTFDNLPIGFSFCYMGQTYTTFSASTNGWGTLGAPTATTWTNNMSTGTPRPIIAPLWDDLNSTTGTLSYQTTGAPGSRVFTVQWLNFQWNYLAAGASISFQMKLYEANNMVEFIYRPEVNPVSSPSASVGITATGTGSGNFLSASDLTATATVSSTVENASIATTPASGLTFDFTPPAPAPPPINMTFTSVTPTGMTVNWVDNSTTESSFTVWRSTDNITFTQVGNVTSTSTATTGNPYTYSATGLSSSTTYYWRVYAANANCPTGFLTGSQATAAGTMCGTYTIGPTGSYTSLTAAIAAVQANGVLCPLVFELQAAYVSNVETFPIVVPFLGSGPATGITVRPELAATNLSITSNAAVTIDMNAASYFVFDGRPGGTGTTPQLTIENTSTTGIAARFQQDAHNSGYTYCKIRGVNTSASGGVMVFANAATAAGNSNNSVTNCELFDSGTQPVNLVYASNTTAGTFSTGNTFTNNLFHDWFSATASSAAMLISTGNSAWTISNNSFYQTATRTHTLGTTHYAINAASGSGTATGGFVISGNFIGGTAANCGGTAYTEGGTVSNVFIAIQTNTGTGGANSIQGNTIKNFNFSTSSLASTGAGTWCGINLLGTSAANNVGTISPNVIGSNSVNGQITTTTSGTGGLTVGINSSASGIQNISNNQVGGITANSTAPTVTTAVVGIQVTSGTTVTISNNTIGSPTSANSMINAVSTSATGGQVSGITCSAASTLTTISNNTVMNLTNQYAGTSTTQYTRGIVTTSGVNNIIGNTIANLTSSDNVSSTTSPAVVGIYQSATSSNQIVSNNTITNLANTSTTGTPNLHGIYYTGSTIGANKIFGNKITGIGAPLSTGTPIINGIYVNGGTSRFYNNMIILGVDGLGNSITPAHEYNGIIKVTTSSNSFFYNSIKIAGTGVASGTANTYAFRRTATSGTDSLYNNVLTNFRSNSSTGGTHYAIGVANTTTVRSNNNDFYGNGTGFAMGLNGATVYNALVNWNAATGLDGASYSVDPNFLSATNLHINTAITSALESRGTTIGNLAIDIDNDVRPGPVGSVNGGGTAPDIGADEFDGIPLSIDMGVQVLVLPSTSGCHTATETVRVRVKNYATQTIDFSTNPVTIVSYTQGVNPVSFPNIILNSGTLAGGGTLDTAVTTTYNMTAVGNHIFRAYTQTVNDFVNSNDSLAAVTIPVSGGTFTAVNGGRLCLGSSMNLSVTGYTNGGTVQWQESPDNITWTNITGATTATYSITPSDTTFYRAMICGQHTSTVDTLFPQYVAPPGTVGATRCGTGPVTMSATGTNLRWYTAPTGGTQVNSGNTYTTTVSNTTTWYVEASSGTPPTAFLTTLAAGNGSAGNMFAITALNTITITSFDGHMPAGTATWEIWYMQQNYNSVPGSTTSNAAWTFIGTAPNVVSNGTGFATPIPISVNVTIPAGSTYSFYVTTTGPTINYTNGTAVNNVYASNADLQFREGHGGGYFSVVNNPRVWNGYIHYSSGCASTRTAVTATVTPAPAIAAAAGSVNPCNGDSVQLSVSSANTGYGYTWTPAANLSSTTGNSVMAGPPTPGMYTYYVDALDTATGCTIEDTVVFQVHAIPTVTASVSNDTVCRGTSINLTAAQPPATVQITNSNVLNTSTTYPAPYGNWFGGARHQMLILASELTSAGLTAGYLNGLTFQVTNTNTSAPLMNFTISMGMTSVTSLTTTFLTSPMTMVYTNPSYAPVVGVNTHNFSTPFYWDGVSNLVVETCFINQTGPTTTSFTTNCTMRQTSTSYNSTVYYFADNNLSVCSTTTGTTATQRPNIAFLRSFSTWAYNWTPVAGISNPAAQNPTAVSISSRYYVVTVTDTTSGCSSSDSVWVYVMPTPQPQLGSDTIICSNTPLTLDASAGPYTYLWSDSSVAQTLTVATFGNYDVLVTDSVNGCTGRDTILVGVNAAPSFTLGSDATICNGTQVTFSGPSGQYSYLWNNAAITQSITTGNAGTYMLTVTDTTNACYASDTVALNVNPLPPVALGNDTAICSANAPLTLSGPSGNYTYLWSDNSTNQTLNVNTTGTYYVVVTDATTSCYSGDTVLISVNVSPTVALGNDTTFCSASGPITLMAPAGSYNYLWNDNTTNSTLTTNTTGTYYVTITDSVTGCPASDTINVNVPMTPVVVLSDTSMCATSYTLTGPAGPYAYMWSNSATTQSINIASPGGSYSLTVTDTTSGCAASDAANVAVNTPPNVTFSLQSTACTTDAAVTLTGSPAGGTFSGPGVSGNVFSPSVAGVGNHTITYSYTDVNGCSGIATNSISVSACVGIDEPFIAAGMNVFPNPTNGSFTLTIQDADYNEMTIEIVTVDGKTIFSDKASNVTGNYVRAIDLGTAANGIYFLRITANGQTFTQKIVKND